MKSKKLKVVAISSSPRRNGNSETLLNKALSGIKAKNINLKKIILADLNIAPCNGCEACFKTGECIIKDAMQTVYNDLLTTDILLIASPIYFKGLPCQLKCIIDRCQALWARKYILKKELTDKKNRLKRSGTVVLVCASSGLNDTFLGAIITIKAWFKTLDIVYKKEFLASGLEEKNAALNNKRLLKRAMEFANKLFSFAKAMETSLLLRRNYSN